MRLKFGKYFLEDWPYSIYEGVGLKFVGKPTDTLRFLDILMVADCNPIASRRILDVLERGEIKQVTVMAGLFFDEIGDSLADIGVQMKIIPPYHYPTKNHIENNAKIDYAVMDHLKGEVSTYVKNLTPTQLKEVERRIIEAKNSISKIPYGFESK